MSSFDLLIDASAFARTFPIETIKLLGEVFDESGISWRVTTHNDVVPKILDKDARKYMSKRIVGQHSNARFDTVLSINKLADSKNKFKRAITYLTSSYDGQLQHDDHLKTSDFVVVPSEDLEAEMSKKLKIDMGCVYTPLDDFFYLELSDEQIIKDLPAKFSFSLTEVISNKNIIGARELLILFSRKFQSSNAFLKIKSSTKLDKDNKILTFNGSHSPKAMASFYLSSNAAISFPYTNQFNYQTIKASLMGRPVVLYNDSSFHMDMPWVLRCHNGNAQQYTMAMESFLDNMDFLFTSWEYDLDSYMHNMVLSHKNNNLRVRLSKKSIKKQIHKTILPVLT